jgi:tetratricopeptide (TPR) repeat protein
LSNTSNAAFIAALISGLLLHAETPEAIFRKSSAALAAHEYGVAEQGFLEVLKLEPGNIGALGNLGVIYSKTHRFSDAIQIYQRALKLAPGEKFLLTNLGLAYLKQERYSQASPVFEKLAADPQNHQARELLATSRLAVGQNELALAALANEPVNPGMLYIRGVALTRLKRTEAAHQAFTEMMSAADPAQANFLMGKASYETEHFQDAADFFGKTLALDPGFEGAHRELGKVLISLHEDDAAEKELRLAGADDEEALYFLGALISHDRPEEATPILDRAHRLNPDFWGPLYYLGRIYVEKNDPKQALPLLERAAKLNPDEAAIQYQLARALQKAGRAAEARAAFAKVKNLKGNSLQKEVDILSPGRR